MIRNILLPLVLLTVAVPAFAQDRTLPAGAFQHQVAPTTYNNKEEGLQQGRSEVTIVRPHRHQAVVR